MKMNIERVWRVLGNVVPKDSKCCGGRWILQDGEVCCPRSGPISVSDSQQKCCDGDYGRQLFNPRTEVSYDLLFLKQNSIQSALYKKFT